MRLALTSEERCTAGHELVWLDEGLGYCRHPGRDWVMFFVVEDVVPRKDMFFFYMTTPNKFGLFAVGKSDDDPVAIAQEAARIRNLAVSGWQE